MDNMSLYQIDKNFKEVLENGFCINEQTGEILFESKDLEGLKMSIEAKINNLIGFIKDTEIQADNYKKISDDYKARYDGKKKKIERLKKYLSDYLQANEMTSKREYLNGTTSFRNTSVLSITNDVDLEKYLLANETYQKYLKAKYEFDKAGLKKELQNGAEIPYCEIRTNNNLQIK